MTRFVPNSHQPSPDTPSSFGAPADVHETIPEVLDAHPTRTSASNGAEPSLRRAAHLLVDRMQRPPHLPAPQLIAVLRDAWGSLPDLRALPPGAERRTALDRLISFCIEEYYRSTHP